MIRVLLVEDHPSMRTGLLTVLDHEPGIVPVGAADGVFNGWALYNSTRPDVVLLDFHLPGESSLRFAQELKALVPTPRVVLHSAHAGPTLALGALLAEVDALLGKGVDARQLSEVLRSVVRGERQPLAHDGHVRQAAADHLRPSDLPMATMLMDGVTVLEIAAALRVPATAVRRRIAAMLAVIERAPVFAGA
jgi:DNA-binding NarL/FixJ family response regulator